MHVVMTGDYPSDPEAVSHGVESVSSYLIRALSKFPDLKLDFVTLDRLGSGKRFVQSGKVTIHYQPASRMPGYFYTLANIRKIHAKLAELEPDLIHVQVAGEYAEAAARTGRPWILTLHGIRFLEVNRWPGILNRVYRGWFVMREERRAIAQARHFISISPFIQSTFGDQIKGPTHSIENPVDDRFFKVPRQPNYGQLLMAAARITPGKNLEVLIKAFAQLYQRIPESTLRIAGQVEAVSSNLSRMKQLIFDLGLGEAVMFLGGLSKAALMKEYETCSVLVLPSAVETAPMVIMEAMAAAKAVVATNVGGIPFLVENNETGLIVPPDDEQALASALYQILRDLEKLEAMGLRAREIARTRFHADAVASKTRKVYYQVLDRKFSGGLK